MPRKLPWKQGGSVTPARAKKSSTFSKSPAKRKRVAKPDPDSDSDGESVPVTRRKSGDRAPSTSPPPKPPSERLMDEGAGNDDMYRMVEDELLSVAQQFTVHLHTAEYKRQEKMVKLRNAQTITSISRPVVGKMPDHTKRRVEGIKLAKTQKHALAGLGKKGGSEGASEDSDDGDGLPYVGTTLHGLMDSPRRKAASIAKLGSVATTTRSAAGFKRPAGQSKDVPSQSPQPKSSVRSSRMAPFQNDTSTESSEGGDDLDAPIAAPRLTKTDTKPPAASEAALRSRCVFPGEIVAHAKIPVPTAKNNSSLSRSNSVKPEKGQTPTKFPETPNSRVSTSSGPRVSRFEQARRLKAQQEKEQQTKKTLDVIPSFL